MSYRRSIGNLYQEGTVITAKDDPALKLLIMKYCQQIYYCAVVGDAARKPLTYFERELIPPSLSDQ
jgi:hypothetical protein